MLEHKIFEELNELCDGEPQWRGSPLHDAQIWGVSVTFLDGIHTISIRVSSCPATNMPSIVGDLVCQDIVEAKIDWRMDDIVVDEFFEEDEGIRVRLWDNETGACCDILAKKMHFRVTCTKNYPEHKEFFFDKREYSLATVQDDGAIMRRSKSGDWEVVAIVPDFDRTESWAGYGELHPEQGTS